MDVLAIQGESTAEIAEAAEAGFRDPVLFSAVSASSAVSSQQDGGTAIGLAGVSAALTGGVLMR